MCSLVSIECFANIEKRKGKQRWIWRKRRRSKRRRKKRKRKGRRRAPFCTCTKKDSRTFRGCNKLYLTGFMQLVVSIPKGLEN